MSEPLYARRPLEIREGIPIFSAADEYSENYETISRDHLAHQRDCGTNPFIREDLWRQAEASTAALLQKHATPGDRVLDVGVGEGRLLSRFPALRRYGVDISLPYLAIARSKGIEVCFARIEELPYRHATFDVAVCTDVLEHVIDLHRCCERILAVLKPGGRLILRVPYREPLQNYVLSEQPYRFVHLRSFDEWSLRLIFERVFGCAFVEGAPGGYGRLPGKLRWKPLPGWERLVHRGLSAVERLSRPAAAALVRRLYEPYEINQVYRRN